jgi:hypothetical protein
MQARSIRRGPSSSSLLPEPQGAAQMTLTVDLQAAIHRYLAEHNADPKPFVWTATPEKIMAKLEPLNASVH